MPVVKTNAIAHALSAATGQPAVFTTGFTSRVARDLDDRPGNFYMTGSMGLALSVGVGIAMVSGRRTLVVDGDGSLLMNPTGLVSAGGYADLPLVHLVIDDGEYESTGGQKSQSGTVDLTNWARDAGFAVARTVDEEEDLVEALAQGMAARASVFVRCLAVPPQTAVPPRVEGPLAEHAHRFTEFFGGRPH